MLSQFACTIESTILKHRMLEPGQRVLAGVSGGADSVALLLVLQELGYTTGVAHLNHGLRGAESDGDERFVEELSSRLQIPFFSRKMTPSGEHGNIEAAGRAARREFFANIMDHSSFPKVAVAHNRNDRVETFLLHLVRGSGLEGLVSMAPVAGCTIRPLIEADRRDIEQYLQFRGQAWRTDATNANVALTRNRMRHVTIPELTRNFNPQLAVTLSKTIEVLQDEDQWMRSLAETWLQKHGTFDIDKGEVDAAALASAPVPLIRRVIRMALKRAGSSLKDVTFDHVEHVRRLLQEGKSGKFVQIPGEIVVSRDFGQLSFRRPSEPAPDFTYNLQIPGAVHIPELGRAFRAEIVDQEMISEDDSRVFVDGGRIGPYVRIRNWKPGDYYKPVGWPAGKLKKLFQRARIPRSQRSRWPVFVTDSAIVWVASFPVSREFVPCGSSQKVVALEAVPPDA